MNQLLGLVDLFFSVCHDETVEILLLVAGVGSIGAALSFLDGALSSDGNLGLRFSFHFLERVTTRTNE